MQALSPLLPYIQIILSVILVIMILMQQTDASLGAVFGGGESAGSGRTRRGFELILFKATIVVAILFVLVTFASFVV